MEYPLEYPNIKAIDELFKKVIHEDARLDELKKKVNVNAIKKITGVTSDESYKIKVFTQTWQDARTAFDLKSDCFAAQVITEAYTTVIRECYTDISGVFIGDKLAYIVYNPNVRFFSDVNQCSMASCRDAKDWYGESIEFYN